jgi:hypothetical protein
MNWLPRSWRRVGPVATPLPGEEEAGDAGHVGLVSRDVNLGGK